MNRLKTNRNLANRRPRCFLGAVASIASSIIGSNAQRRERRRQERAQDYTNMLEEAKSDSEAMNSMLDYTKNYLSQFNTVARLGTRKRSKLNNNIFITDGGDAVKIDKDTYLLRGGSHEQTNETGQTGIGINVGGNEVEAEGGEVAQKKNGALRIFSAQPILGNGMSPAQAILRGYNKDKVFNAQQAFKKRNGLKDDGSKAKHGTEVPYKRIHINEDGTFTDTLTGKNYNTSATNGEDVVITGKANHWKEAGKKDTSSYFDPMGAVNFITAAGAPILNANPSNIVGSIRDSKSANDFLKHYMMQDTGGFVNTEWAKEHPYLSLGINTIGDIGLGIGTNKAVDILRHPLEYGKYGYKLNKLYKKAGLLDRGEYKTIQENYEKLLDYYTGNKPYDAGAADFTYDIKARNNAENVNPDIFYNYVTPSKGERAEFSRAYRKKATDNAFTEMYAPIRYGFDFGKSNDVKAYEDLMNHNPEYYKFLKETKLPWNEQSTVDAFLKRQQTSLRGVYANDKETAKDYLTRILGARKGGDRLDTHGGLYTSNSTGIANAFKNPDNGISNGYIGKLVYDFDIDKTKPIADQLRQARMKIVRGGRNNVFTGTRYYPQSITEARKQGAVAIEDNYGRSNGDVLNVTERAYFPGSAKQNKLTLQNLEEYLAQENQKGRWNTSGVDKMKGDEELFIPREYNRFDDFIREARIFMQPRREYDSDKERKFMEELYDRMQTRSKYRNSLIDMSRRLRRRNERNSNDFDVNKQISLMDFYEPLMDSYGPFRFGGRCKLRNGGWKAPVYNTKKYRVSNRMRRQIVTWEGSDFVGQNRKFNGDAIGAKERELRQMMGRTYNYLTDNQRDSLNSIYYNSRVDTFKNRFSKWFRNLNDAVDRGDERAFNNSLAGIKQSMTIGENRQGMSGLAKRRAWERNWFGNPIPIDSNETKAILKQQAEARMVQPTDNTRVVIQPEYIEVPAPVGHGVVPVDNPNPNLLQGNIKDNLINMGNRFRLEQRCGGKTRMRCGGKIRMRKALGCESRPVKGMRCKLAWGDIVYPYRRNNNFDYWDIINQGQKSNDKGGITPWTTSNKYDVKVPYAITKSTPTIPYTTKNYTPSSKSFKTKTSQNDNGNKSGMILRNSDWYSLGADLIGTIGAGIIGANSASNTYIPEAPVRYQATKLNTNYNITPQLEIIRRSRNRLANEVAGNTSSSVAAINRLNLLENNANEQLNKLYDVKENRESELLNQDALNQQSVSAQNVQAINDYNYRVAELKNARTQAMGNVLTGTLQGIGNSFQNLISQGRQNYDDTQAMLMGIAASDYATPSRLLELGVDVGDDAALAGIYRSAMNIPNPGAKPKREDYSDNTEYSYALTRWENQNKAYQRRNSYADLIKGRMSKKNLIKYGII